MNPEKVEKCGSIQYSSKFFPRQEKEELDNDPPTRNYHN
jgi:hypothetical protein